MKKALILLISILTLIDVSYADIFTKDEATPYTIDNAISEDRSGFYYRGGIDYKQYLNPASVETLSTCKLESSLKESDIETRYQFERMGYFRQDPKDSTPDRLVFNRIVTLRDTWTTKK